MSTLIVKGGRKLEGECRLPGDKSISHRAAILAALAEGESRIEGFSGGEDNLRTVGALRRLGVEMAVDGDTLQVQGVGLHGLRAPEGVIDCGNSGTTMRLLLGLLAAQPFASVLDGDNSLRRRPMARVADPLRRMGASIEGDTERGREGDAETRRGGEMKAPLRVEGGQLKGMRQRIPVASAQVKTALLLAGLHAEGETWVEEPAMSRDHTERLMVHLGIPLLGEGRAMGSEGSAVGIRGPAASFAGRKIEIPGDFSSAAFILAVAALIPGSRVTVSGVGLNPSRTGFLEVARAMGAEVEVKDRTEDSGEPVGRLVIHGPGERAPREDAPRGQATRLRGIKVGDPLVPRLIDELPLVAVLGAHARGATVIADAAELRVKESDRIARLAGGLRTFGVEVEERPDGMVVYQSPCRAARVSSRGDHRLAMAFAVMGLTVAGETVIEGTECIKVSFPDFVETMQSLGAEMELR